MAKVRISIVTSVFNDLEGLKETGKSVLTQDYPVEWIVIDSDSGAETRKYLKGLKSSKHKISWKSERDLGLYDGMNKGFELSTGEIILFLNAGDTLQENDTISKVIATRIQDEWNWSVGLAVRINRNKEPQSIWEYYRPTLGGLALGTRTFCHQAIFYSREILKKVMPYKIENLAADHLLNIKAFRIARPTMLTFVTTLFMDGGISSKRPLSAAFKDLRDIRIEENLLLLNSSILDYFLTKLVVFIVRFGGIAWHIMRIISHQFVKEPVRILPTSENHESFSQIAIDHENRS